VAGQQKFEFKTRYRGVCTWTQYVSAGLHTSGTITIRHLINTSVASACKVEAVTSHVDVPGNTNYLKHKLRTAFELVGLAEESPCLPENENQNSRMNHLFNEPKKCLYFCRKIRRWRPGKSKCTYMLGYYYYLALRIWPSGLFQFRIIFWQNEPPRYLIGLLGGGDRPIARPLLTQDSTNNNKKKSQIYIHAPNGIRTNTSICLEGLRKNISKGSWYSGWIRTEHFPNTSPECYRQTNLFGGN
jgi:hypothetical protein